MIGLFACFAGVSAMLAENKDKDDIRSVDVAVGVVLIFVSLPIFPPSWLAVAGLTLYIPLFANGGSNRRRGAIILLALTVPMLWSRLLFNSSPDSWTLMQRSWLRSWVPILSATWFIFAGGSGYMFVLALCSSPLGHDDVGRTATVLSKPRFRLPFTVRRIACDIVKLHRVHGALLWLRPGRVFTRKAVACPSDT